MGLWAESNPVPPWEWRAQQRNGGAGGSGGSVPAVVTGGTSSTSKVVYHGNTLSNVFHEPSCKDYNCKNCTVVLGSVNEAISAGYRGHRQCGKE